MSKVEQICNFAVSQVGVPFVLGRRMENVALDCVGLLLATARACGIVLKDPAPYTRRDLIHWDVHQIAIDCGLIPKNGLIAEKGDIIRLAINSKFPVHFGIVVGDQFIHACDRNRKTVCKPFLNCFDSLVRGVYQWPHSH